MQLRIMAFTAVFSALSFQAGPGSGSLDRAHVVELKQVAPLERTSLTGLPRGTEIDATRASWIVATSTVPEPDAGAACDAPQGPLPTNPYPLRIIDSPAAMLRGGLFRGELSQTADWEHAYCNSAAVFFRNSPAVEVRDVRIDSAWDAIRFTARNGPASDDFLVEQTWITRNRDDCIENDAFYSGRITDVLCESFVGLSVAASGADKDVASVLTVEGTLFRALPYPYKGARRYTGIVKASLHGMRLRIYDSVFMMGKSEDYAGAPARQWDRIDDCRGNLFIWASDEPIPEEIGSPPPCFQIVRGREKGLAAWDRVRRNWIDCHPGLRRLADDPESTPGNCDPARYGGQY